MLLLLVGLAHAQSTTSTDQLVIPLGAAIGALVTLAGSAVAMIGLLVREAGHRATSDAKLDGVAAQLAPLVGLAATMQVHGTRLDNVDKRLDAHSRRMDGVDCDLGEVRVDTGALKVGVAELRAARSPTRGGPAHG